MNGVPDLPLSEMVPYISPLQWRYNGHDGVSNHQPYHCLLNRLFSADQRNIKAPRYWPFVRGIHRRPVNSPHKWPVTRKMFSFDDVIMSLHGHHADMYFVLFKPQLFQNVGTFSYFNVHELMASMNYSDYQLKYDLTKTTLETMQFSIVKLTASLSRNIHRTIMTSNYPHIKIELRFVGWQMAWNLS